MSYFTDNPLERVMVQKPSAPKETPPAVHAPKGHHCYGCGRYGMACMLPCYRDREPRDKTRSKPEL